MPIVVYAMLNWSSSAALGGVNSSSARTNSFDCNTASRLSEPRSVGNSPKKSVGSRINILPELSVICAVSVATASGSGLDPHISPANADLQVARVARARGMAPERVRELVARYTEGRQFGIFGEPRVNVLLLNIALDSLD